MADPIGLGISEETHDLYLDDAGNLVMATKARAIGEHAKQRLMFFKNEWFLDTTAGLPWLPRPGRAFHIFDRPYNAGASEAIIKAEILDTPGVVEMTSFEARLDQVTRGLNIEAEIVTTYDDAETIGAEVSA